MIYKSEKFKRDLSLKTKASRMIEKILNSLISELENE